jgi:ribosomal protein S18 acetylase RimI-like enzyme
VAKLIQRIDITDHQWASDLLEVQTLAYRVEANLIGYDTIPPLHEDLAALQATDETFLGYVSDGKIYGALSYTRDGGIVDICRVYVHPSHFRKGIAQALLLHLLQLEENADKVVVSTGADNLPAVRLYQKHGFVEVGQTEVATGIHITHLERVNTSG